MMGKINRLLRLVVCAIALYIVVFAVPGNTDAKSKKVRLNVGFGSEEVLENLQTTPLQVTEMGAVYWPLVYDQ